jgi:hypothetical protein
VGTAHSLVTERPQPALAGDLVTTGPKPASLLPVWLPAVRFTTVNKDPALGLPDHRRGPGTGVTNLVAQWAGLLQARSYSVFGVRVFEFYAQDVTHFLCVDAA